MDTRHRQSERDMGSLGGTDGLRSKSLNKGSSPNGIRLPDTRKHVCVRERE